MTPSPLVSVLMPAFNSETTIAAAIEGILHQTYQNWELILLDDGSVDDTWRKAQGYRVDARIRCERAGRNLGRGGARNACLAIARGEYVAIADADDISFPERLGRQVSHLEKHPELDGVSAQLAYFDGNGAIWRPFSYPQTQQAIRERFERRKMALANAACMFRRSIFDRYGGYDERFRHSEDFAFLYPLRRQCRFESVPETLVYYRSERNMSTWRKWKETEVGRRMTIHLDQTADATTTTSQFARRMSTVLALHTVDLLRFARVRIAGRSGRDWHLS